MSGLPDWTRRRGAQALRLRASRARPRHDVARLCGSDGRACFRPSRCWSSASRRRSIRRARLRASMCSGCRCACCPPKSAATPPATSPRATGIGSRTPTPIVSSKSSSATRRERRPRSWPAHVESPADLERAQSEPRRRRQSRRQPPSGAELSLPPGAAAGRGWNTPVGDLCISSAPSTWPGAGTGAGSGYMLAKHAVRGFER